MIIALIDPEGLYIVGCPCMSLDVLRYPTCRTREYAFLPTIAMLAPSEKKVSYRNRPPGRHSHGLTYFGADTGRGSPRAGRPA